MDIDPDTIFPRKKIGRDRQVRDMFRNGKVIDRKHDPKRGPLVRVQYLDKMGLITQWIPVKQFGSRLTMHYYCPKIGDDVNVCMLPNGSEDGFVDGSFFNAGNPPPEDLDIDTRHFKTEDETVVEYREKDSTFNMNCAGKITIHANETILIDADSWIHIIANGEIIITSDVKVTITAPEIELNGHMTFNGDITHIGNMTTSGVHTDANGIHCIPARAAKKDVSSELRMEDEGERSS
jgi:phage baseplate assembly protein V